MGDIIRGTSSLSGLYRGTQEIWTSAPGPVLEYPSDAVVFKHYAHSYPAYIPMPGGVDIDSSWNFGVYQNNTSDCYVSAFNGGILETETDYVDVQIDFSIRTRASGTEYTTFYIDIPVIYRSKGQGPQTGFPGWPTYATGKPFNRSLRLINWASYQVKQADENGNMVQVDSYDRWDYTSWRTCTGTTFWRALPTFGENFQFGKSLRVTRYSGSYTGAQTQLLSLKITPVAAYN